HLGGVVTEEERLVAPPRIVAVEEVNDLRRDFLVDCFRPLQGQRTLVLACHVLGAAVRFAREHRTRGCQTDGCFWIYRAGDFSHAGDRRVLARRGDGLLRWSFVDVGEAHPLHSLQWVTITPAILECMR